MAEDIEKLDKKYIWHPFAQMRDWQREDQIIIESGKGSWLRDTRGRKYLDGVSSLWVNVHGHRKKEMDRAIQKQLGKIAHSTLLGLGNVPSALLARELIRIAPKGLRRVFYSDSGSTSVEVALKMAFQYFQLKGDKNRRLFLSLKNGYHGDTIGSVSVGGIPLFHERFGPLLFKVLFASSPYEIEKILHRHRGRIAAVVVEPMIQAASGMLTMPPGTLKKIERLCKKHGALLIADEVATGFGRTGKMFACEHEDVHPDLLCMAKGLTGGYLPLAATLTTEKIYKAFLGEYSEFKTFFHGHTYTGNPLACAAALENLRLFRRERVLEKLQPKIYFLSRELERFKEMKHVGDVRQLGFMAGIELVEDKTSRRAYPLEKKMGIKVCAACRPKGVLLRPLGNVIVLMPPLSISLSELQKILDAVWQSVQEVCG